MDRFNLLDEGWIPVVVKGNRSLEEVFSNTELSFLGGTPTQKIAVLSLLIAIAQAAATPQDTREWAALGPDGLGQKCVDYLNRWHDAFWLYGDKPFLQMPACAKAKLKPYGMAMPHVASGNATLLTQLQVEPAMSDATRALLLVEQMGYAIGGMAPDSSIVLSEGYTKRKSAYPGPFLSYSGLLHSFLKGNSILETVWLNMFTHEDVAHVKQWGTGVGIAPWERMPEGEDCPTARALKSSLMGSLVPLSRFCLLQEDGLRITEGIVHPYGDDGIIPSVAYSFEKGKTSFLWADPERNPSKHIPQMLRFLKEEDGGLSCLFIKNGIQRLLISDEEINFSIWQGGLSVSWNMGNFISGMNDYVESDTPFSSALVLKKMLPQLEEKMELLEKMAQVIYATVKAYYEELLSSSAKEHAQRASQEFKIIADSNLSKLIKYFHIQDLSLRTEKISQFIIDIINQGRNIYDQACPHGAARQFEIWAKYRPMTGNFNIKKIYNEKNASDLQRC